MSAPSVVAGNWKMNLDLAEARILTSEVTNMLQDEMLGTGPTVILAPPFVYLQEVLRLVKGYEGRVKVAAQNCHAQTKGAYTGEVSALMLQSMGVEYVILGHSERREYFHETEAQLLEKLNVALAHGLTPIFCCGENLEVREAGNHLAFVSQQLQETLCQLSAEAFTRVIVAYEPIWAIGTGKTASAQQAQEMHAALRQTLAQTFGAQAQNTPILYGGSVKPGNAAEIFAQPDVNGGLVGGASLQSRDFSNIVKAAV